MDTSDIIFFALGIVVTIVAGVAFASRRRLLFIIKARQLGAQQNWGDDICLRCEEPYDFFVTTTVRITNTGNRTIHGDAIAQNDPLRIFFPIEAIASRIEKAPAANNVTLEKDGKNYYLHFDYMDRGDSITLAFLNPTEDYLKPAVIRGKIKGCRFTVSETKHPYFFCILMLVYHLFGITLISAGAIPYSINNNSPAILNITLALMLCALFFSLTFYCAKVFFPLLKENRHLNQKE